MRRRDKETTSQEVFTQLMDDVLVGYLALMQEDGYPRSIPLNFVYSDDAIYFHGARAGEKFELLRQRPRVSFCVPQVLSYIPSGYLGGDPCEATHFYRSAMFYGTGSIVESAKEKRAALVALLEKYQPGDRKNLMDDENPGRERTMEKTAVFKIEIERHVMKQNLGEYMSPENRETVMKKLRDSAGYVNRLTARLMSWQKK